MSTSNPCLDVDASPTVERERSSQPFPDSLRWSSSNIVPEEIARILRTFGVARPWRQMTALADRSGFGALPLDALLATATQRRHLAAHDPSANVALVDLTSFLQESTALALTFDCLITQGTRVIRQGDPQGRASASAITEADVRLRYLDRRGPGKWAEIGEEAQRAHRIFPTREAGVLGSTQRATELDAALIVRSAAKVPIDWTIEL
jgi:hypothetical protein